MSTVVALHENCVVCLTAEEYAFSSTEAVMTVLMLLGRDISGEQIIRDLCFSHRRELDECVKRWRKAEPG